MPEVDDSRQTKRALRAIIQIGLVCGCLVGAVAGRGAVEIGDINDAPHFYKTRELRDRFTLLMPKLASHPGLDRSSEKEFLRSLLKILEVPVGSQMLVFSTTSLQLSLISPRNPRAVYFNEDIYVGFIPGGKIEIVSLDPALGGIFYIFEIPRDGRPLSFDRSNRCMNCHAAEETGYVPGLVVKSVAPGPSGGSLDEFRIGQSGHGIAWEERFGGWHVTGRHGITNHWGNLTGRFENGNLLRLPNEMGQRFDTGKYLAETSDILAHLLHEHQVGFVNRAVEAGYRARAGMGEAEAREQAGKLARYLLFADEAALPGEGVEGDAGLKADFLRGRRVAEGGISLKDFDLKTRLFKHRCSYMIHSPVFTGLPTGLKERIYRELARALDVGRADPEYAYLPNEEKLAIRRILKGTVGDLPGGF